MKRLETLNLFDKKYIIFDMDGTLIDSVGIWNYADQKIIEQFGNIQVDLDIIQKQREDFLEKNIKGDIYVEYSKYIINKYNLNVSLEELINTRKSIAHEILKNELDFKPGVVELIKQLKEMGFLLILATITTTNQIDIYAHHNKKMSSQMNLYDVFDLVLTKDDVKNKKPNPEIYINILNHYNADASECLIFEDSLHGVLAAKGAGIETVNIYDYYSEKDREQINNLTDYKIDSYRQFLDDVVYKERKSKK